MDRVEQEERLRLLYDLADKQHPHMAGDNHTRKIIDKVFSDERLAAHEAFDAGKYYQRMLNQYDAVLDNIPGDRKDKPNYLGAILDFRYESYKDK